MGTGRGMAQGSIEPRLLPFRRYVDRDLTVAVHERGAKQGMKVNDKRQWGHDYRCTHARRSDCIRCSRCADTRAKLRAQNG